MKEKLVDALNKDLSIFNEGQIYQANNYCMNLLKSLYEGKDGKTFSHEYAKKVGINHVQFEIDSVIHNLYDSQKMTIDEKVRQASSEYVNYIFKLRIKSNSFLDAVETTISRLSKELSKEDINYDVIKSIATYVLEYYFKHDMINIFSSKDGSRGYVFNKTKEEIIDEIQKDINVYSNVIDVLIKEYSKAVSEDWISKNLNKKATL